MAVEIHYDISLNGNRYAGYIAPMGSTVEYYDIPHHFQVYHYKKGGLYYWGMLMLTDKWVWHCNANFVEGLEEKFVEVVILWYQ